MAENIEYKWLLLTTSVPYGFNNQGHVVVEGVGLDSDFMDSHRTQITWGFKDNKLVKCKANVNATNSLSNKIQIVNNAGKTAFLLPAGLGSQATVSYIYTPIENKDLTGWTVSGCIEIPSTVSEQTDATLVQTFNSVNVELPVGVPIPWVSETIPKGFLPYTGISFDVEAFPELAILYPNGVLIDLQGDFLRAAQVGRAIMSREEQSVQPLNYDKFINVNATMTSSVSQGTHAVQNDKWTPILATGDAYKWKGGLRFMNGSRVVDGTGEETRPDNTGVIYITRAA